MTSFYCWIFAFSCLDCGSSAAAALAEGFLLELLGSRPAYRANLTNQLMDHGWLDIQLGRQFTHRDLVPKVAANRVGLLGGVKHSRYPRHYLLTKMGI